MTLKLTGPGGLFENKKVLWAVTGIGIAVILLIFFSTFSSEKNEEEPGTGVSSAQLERELEQRLESLLSQIDGVSSPKVMLTLDSTEERIFAEETKSSSDTGTSGENTSASSEEERSVVLTNGGREALEKSVVLPKVRGVAVVCVGADNALIKEKVVNAVSGVLNISSSRVYVTN